MGFPWGAAPPHFAERPGALMALAMHSCPAWRSGAHAWPPLLAAAMPAVHLKPVHPSCLALQASCTQIYSLQLLISPSACFQYITICANLRSFHRNGNVSCVTHLMSWLACLHPAAQHLRASLRTQRPSILYASKDKSRATELHCAGVD